MDTDRNDEMPDNTSAAEDTEGRDHDLTRTKDHDTIRRWADDHHATPRRRGTRRRGRAGRAAPGLRGRPRHRGIDALDWGEWFAAFDERGLTFAYDDGMRPDGSPTNYFHLEGPDERA